MRRMVAVAAALLLLGAPGCKKAGTANQSDAGDAGSHEDTAVKEWSQRLGLAADVRVATVERARALGKAETKGIEIGSIQVGGKAPAPEDGKLEALRIVLKPGAAHEWTALRDFGKQLRTKAKGQPGAPDLLLTSPDVAGAAGIFPAADGTDRTVEIVDGNQYPPPEERRASIEELEITKIVRSYGDEVPRSIKFEGRVHNLSDQPLHAVSVHVDGLGDPGQKSLPSFDFAVRDVPAGGTQKFSHEARVTPGTQFGAMGLWAHEVRLDKTPLPGFDPKEYAHDVDFARLRVSVLEPAGASPYMQLGRIVTGGTWSHGSFCLHRDFLALAPPEREAKVRRLVAAIEDHGKRHGERRSEITFNVEDRPIEGVRAYCNDEVAKVAEDGTYRDLGKK